MYVLKKDITSISSEVLGSIQKAVKSENN